MLAAANFYAVCEDSVQAQRDGTHPGMRPCLFVLVFPPVVYLPPNLDFWLLGILLGSMILSSGCEFAI